MDEKPRFCGVFAHPDDESFSMGGLTACYSEAGAEILFIQMTRGEEGKPGDPPICSKEEIGAVREDEMRNAARILGALPPVFLGYRDKEVGLAEPGEAVARIVRELRRFRPHVVFSFAADGGSGHDDHRATSALAQLAFRLVREPSYRPDLGAPWTPVSLYLTARAQGAWEALEAIPADDPLPRTLGLPVTTVVDVKQWGAQKLEALHAHRTQHLTVERALTNLDAEGKPVWLATESFHRLLPPYDPREGIEHSIYWREGPSGETNRVL